MWKKTHRTVRGVTVPGDDSVPPTKWWNHLWLLFFVWRRIAVFQLDGYGYRSGYHVGYKDFRDRSRICDQVLTSKWFRVRVGHESCTFFAIDRLGNEILFRLLAITDKKNPNYRTTPLI